MAADEPDLGWMKNKDRDLWDGCAHIFKLLTLWKVLDLYKLPRILA